MCTGCKHACDPDTAHDKTGRARQLAEQEGALVFFELSYFNNTQIDNIKADSNIMNTHRWEKQIQEMKCVSEGQGIGRFQLTLTTSV